MGEAELEVDSESRSRNEQVEISRRGRNQNEDGADVEVEQRGYSVTKQVASLDREVTASGFVFEISTKQKSFSGL